MKSVREGCSKVDIGKSFRRLLWEAVVVRVEGYLDQGSISGERKNK